MEKKYSSAGISITNAGDDKPIPVLQNDGARYSGFHQGAGEIAAAELLASDYQKYGLVLIDEIETSLHPRAQRRLVRDLAKIAREREIQIILSTHSPYVLAELPPEARIYLMDGVAGKTAVTGVSPDFAMSRMDEEQHPECDVYVEDSRAATMVAEVLANVDKNLLSRSKLIPFGAASVGKALGLMAAQKRFPRPSLIFLDGDQDPSDGCFILPGQDAPEIVIFSALKAINWQEIPNRIGRPPSETIDALNDAMTIADHHKWLNSAGDRLLVGSEIIWQALCSVWADKVASDSEKIAISQPVMDALP